MKAVPDAEIALPFARLLISSMLMRKVVDVIDYMARYTAKWDLLISNMGSVVKFKMLY